MNIEQKIADQNKEAAIADMVVAGDCAKAAQLMVEHVMEKVGRLQNPATLEQKEAIEAEAINNANNRR